MGLLHLLASTNVDVGNCYLRGRGCTRKSSIYVGGKPENCFVVGE